MYFVVMAAKFSTLQICGNILSTKDFGYFALRCALCERIFGQLSSFIEHLGTNHVQNKTYWSTSFEDKNYSEIASNIQNENCIDYAMVRDDICEMNSSSTELCDYEDLSEDIDNCSNIKPFIFDLRSDKYVSISLDFLNLWKQYEFLFDVNHIKNPVLNTKNEAYFQIKLALEKKGYSITNSGISSTISHITEEYEKIKNNMLANKELDHYSRCFFKKCNFLNKFNNQHEDKYDIKISNYNIHNSDEEGSPKSGLSKDAEVVECTLLNRPYKRIRFHIMPNRIATELINLLRSEPVLWDKTRRDYNNIYDRKKILQKWNEIFLKRYETNFSHEDFSLNLQALHRYYNSILKRKDLNEAAKRILEMCNFLPSRTRSARIKCQQCDSFFLNDKNYKAHLFETHKIGENPFKCIECKKDFKSASILDNHIANNHIKDYKFTCDFCEKKFLRKSQFDAHVAVHTGIHRFICETCGKSFRRKMNLQYHETRIHLRLRNFKCHLCTKAFYTKALLRDHINAHLNIRNHKCPTCNKGFHSAHSLMRHKQIHSTIKRYACKLCDARFNQFVGLNSHMKSRHKFVVSQETPRQMNPVLIKEMNLNDLDHQAVEVVLN